MDGLLLMVIGPLVVKFSLVCLLSVTKEWLFTLGQTSNPNLAWKKVDVLKIYSDDDDSVLVGCLFMEIQNWAL